MQYKKLLAPSLKDLFIKEIQEKILSGELEIGTQLPTERELAELMGINRNIIHSGISIMVQRGFLEIRPRIGTFVADYNRIGSVDTLVSMMNYNGGMLRKQEVRSSIELKILFDSFAIIQMSKNLTTENIKQLEYYLEEIDKTIITSEIASLAYEFFRYMSIISNNTILPLIYNSFRPSNQVLFERHIRLYGRDITISFLKRLLTYITQGQVDEAVSFLTNYYKRSISGDLEIYSE